MGYCYSDDNNSGTWTKTPIYGNLWKMDKKYPHVCPICNKEVKFEHMMKVQFLYGCYTKDFGIDLIKNVHFYKFKLRNYLVCYKEWKFLKDNWKTQFREITINGKMVKIPQAILCCDCFCRS